jgi:gliding motility-associated-like protein
MYYDLVDNSEIQVQKDIKVQWKEGETSIATVLSPQIYDPPTKNTDYTFRVYDKFNCESLTTVTYESIVTKAKFTADPMDGEAPLEVTFSNQSENGDLDRYEWFFFRDLDEIKQESQGTDAEIDSIDIVAFDESPIFTYEHSGSYMVKLVSKKISEFHTCVDTAYLEDYIIVDSSFIAVPNVFTPNGDGTNDEFVVKFWSMQSIEISIFNRWGKKIHFWKSGDVRGFEGTFTETVWDGRLMGGRYASPGVYYYNVVGEGRDGERRRAHRFFHLFRDKD